MELLGYIILSFSFVSIVVWLWVNYDFFNRKFETLEERSHWRKSIFNSFNGPYKYFYRFYIKELYWFKLKM